ncbi:hypothetical protein TNCV_4637811 [Trichonephila clavipes]|uniref:Uncharacterized protein n=1 Tax=Trichonephila clavipes TaxID=2585209 RepID=A0A8X7BJH3_TRICX|nr:hypothetical protein TNCV_4637811 [Trichonephila clavipes]
MRGLAARRLFRIPPFREGTIHLQTSMFSPEFKPTPNVTAVSVSNYYTGWATIEEVVDLVRQINIEVVRDEVLELPNYHNQELAFVELIEMLSMTESLSLIEN